MPQPVTSVTGFAMTHCKECGKRAVGDAGPYGGVQGVRRGGALLPTVVPTDSRPLSWPPIGALPRNRLASSATGGASVISPPVGGVEPRPYESDCRGGRPCPPGPDNATPCRAGPVCPAGVRGKNPPVTASPCQPPFRQGGRGNGGCGLPQPVTSVTGFAMTHCKECGRRADVGSELSAAGGRGSEVSEWPRSKF